MSAFTALHDRGAHFVLARANKRAIATEWQTTPADLAHVERHARGDGLIGVVPASLGCFVVDVDEGGKAGVETVRTALGDPVAVIATRRPSGFHVWYPRARETSRKPKMEPRRRNR